MPPHSRDHEEVPVRGSIPRIPKRRPQTSVITAEDFLDYDEQQERSVIEAVIRKTAQSSGNGSGAFETNSQQHGRDKSLAQAAKRTTGGGLFGWVKPGTSSSLKTKAQQNSGFFDLDDLAEYSDDISDSDSEQCAESDFLPGAAVGTTTTMGATVIIPSGELGVIGDPGSHLIPDKDGWKLSAGRGRGKPPPPKRKTKKKAIGLPGSGGAAWEALPPPTFAGRGKPLATSPFGGQGIPFSLDKSSAPLGLRGGFPRAKKLPPKPNPYASPFLRGKPPAHESSNSDTPQPKEPSRGIYMGKSLVFRNVEEVWKGKKRKQPHTSKHQRGYRSKKHQRVSSRSRAALLCS